MNVREYFELAFHDFLGCHADQTMRENLKSMPLDSTCGDDCKAVIDAASVFAHQVRKAFGDDQPDWIRDIAWTAAHTCQCFICG